MGKRLKARPRVKHTRTKDPTAPWIETTIKGRDGRVGYVTVPLRFGASYRLGLQLASVLAPVLGSAAAAFFGLDNLEEEGPEETAKGIDFSHAVDSLGQLPEKLLELGGEDLIMRIFAETIRISPEGKKQHLRSEQGLTDAYAGGNFGEMFRAVWWVLKANYGPFGPESAGGLLEWLDGLPTKLERLNLSLSTTPSSAPKSNEELIDENDELTD